MATKTLSNEFMQKIINLQDTEFTPLARDRQPAETPTYCRDYGIILTTSAALVGRGLLMED